MDGVLDAAGPTAPEGGPAGGERPPLVVLVHGARDQGSSFERVTALLGDLEVLSYDRRGWGDDPAWDGVPAGVDGHTDDLLALIGERPVTVVGHSWGGHVAVAAAIRRPDLIASVGLWETALQWEPWWPADHRQLISNAVARLREKPPGTPRQNRERLLFVAEATEMFTAPYDLARLKARCIVGYGDAPFPIFEPGVRAFARLMDAERFELPGATHMAHRENPVDFARFVRRAVALSRPSAAA
ncbi:alpha/beta hydrolase [Frankia sp. AgB1.9]|nr:alpha/beta hydrolase [Frankia sp. AgW1.1]MBL7548552.1 alpha/beta hydrolase [Frankia sp. AgB1.9]MBL7619551.1 alpha/beta hydrolase [Frankia sp. AgB1.8]